MKRRHATTMVNAAGAALAIAVAVVIGYQRRPSTTVPLTTVSNAITAVRHLPTANGEPGIADAAGHVVPLRRYDRIVSTNLVSDRLLFEMSEPARVLAVSRVSATTSPWRWRFAGKPIIDGMGPLEAIIALKPDLVLMNVFGAEGRTEKLRNAGIQVFNLGELRGVRTFVPTAQAIAALLGAPERGQALAATFQQRMARVAGPLGARPRRRAVYLAAIGSIIIGGTRGTSYHDVLVSAGLIDAAADRHFDWPQYRPEEIAALNADIIVTKDGLAAAVCGHPGMETLRPCQQDGQVITLPEGLVEDPGMGMLDAAEMLFAKAYPGL